MYKCTICNMEYNKKPDFCDCGNDEFVFNEDIKKEEYKEIKKEPKKPNKKENKGDTISLIIFIICIILSIIFLLLPVDFFAKGGVKEEISAPETKKETIDLPDIDKLWIENKIEKINKEEIKKPEIKVEENVYKNNPQIKPQPKKEQQKQGQKQGQINTQKTQTNTQNLAQNKPKTPSIPQIQQQTQQQIQQTQNTTNIEQQKIEFTNYKIQLRSAIASKINFAAIAGDGTCVVSFKISNNGQITNRTFLKLSENETLNDAVYQGLSKLNYYNPPPEYYKNEELKLTVTMQNSTFTVILN